MMYYSKLMKLFAFHTVMFVSQLLDRISTGFSLALALRGICIKKNHVLSLDNYCVNFPLASLNLLLYLQIITVLTFLVLSVCLRVLDRDEMLLDH